MEEEPGQKWIRKSPRRPSPLQNSSKLKPENVHDPWRFRPRQCEMPEPDIMRSERPRLYVIWKSLDENITMCDAYKENEMTHKIHHLQKVLHPNYEICDENDKIQIL